jgi:hypothetical protein
MTKPTVTDEVMTQAIHAAIKETGLIDIISNLDHQKKAQDAELLRLHKAIQSVIDDCEADYPPSHGAIKHALKQALQPTIFGFPIVIDPTVKGFEFRNKEPTP